MKTSAVHQHYEELGAMVDWWRSLYRDLAEQGDIDMPVDHLRILEAMMHALLSPLGNVLAANGYDVLKNVEGKTPDERQEAVDAELVRLFLGHAYMLGRGIVRVDAPPVSVQQLDEVDANSEWDRLPAPPRWSWFDKFQPM